MRRFLLIGVAFLASCSGAQVVIGEAGQPAETDLPTLEVLIADSAGTAVAGATVAVGRSEFTADDTGTVTAPWLDQPVDVAVAAAGYHPGAIQVIELPAEGPAVVTLQPVVLEGSVTNQAGLPLAGTTVRLGGRETVTNDAGSYRFEAVTPDVITVERPAFEPVSEEWDGATERVDFTVEPRMIRGLRVSGPAAGSSEVWPDLLELAESTEINALVVDTKDETGAVFFNTVVNTAHEIGAVDVAFVPETIVEELHSRDLYAITRIVTFQDRFLGEAFPDLAVADSAGGTWKTGGGETWLDATNRDAWEYPLALAEDACRRGFDEIQFDYVRFPTDGPVDRAVFVGGYSEQIRVDTISAFLAEARTRLNPLGCAVAADIFSVVLSSFDDQGLGQRVQPLSNSVDVISPMIYPSHYSTGWFGYECPNDHPGEVVGSAMDDGMPQLTGAAIIRPWIQDFSFGCGPVYRAAEVREQIEVVEDNEAGWMLWNARSRFTTDALLPAGSVATTTTTTTTVAATGDE